MTNATAKKHTAKRVKFGIDGYRIDTDFYPTQSIYRGILIERGDGWVNIESKQDIKNTGFCDFFDTVRELKAYIDNKIDNQGVVVTPRYAVDETGKLTYVNRTSMKLKKISDTRVVYNTRETRQFDYTDHELYKTAEEAIKAGFDYYSNNAVVANIAVTYRHCSRVNEAGFCFIYNSYDI